MTVPFGELQARLRDERGGRVAFVSHCLLNENTRYLGGAFRAGGVAELVGQLLEDGVGLVRRSFDAIARMPAKTVSRSRVNWEVVLACRRAGRGLFVQALCRELARRGLSVPLLEHDLVAEMRDEQQRTWPP